MHTARLALSVLAAAGLVLTGCAERNYSETHAQAAEARIAELERQLEEKHKGEAEGVANAGGTPGQIVNPGGSLGNEVDVWSKDREIHIELSNNILFDPGKAALKAEARAVIGRVLVLLKKDYPDHEIQVVGHTDNQVISRTKNSWDDNWDLAGGRARVVLHYLHEKGIPYNRLSFAGYADQKPRASNSSDAGKAKNRRVEIVVIPKSGKTIDATDKSDKAAPAADTAEGS